MKRVFAIMTAMLMLASHANAAKVGGEQGSKTMGAPSVAQQVRTVAARILPAARALCRQYHGDDPRCVFNIRVTGSRLSARRAMFEYRGEKPVISISRAMVAATRNQTELAFVLAHEMAHQLAQHPVQGAPAQFNGAGGVAAGGGFSIQRPEPKHMESEADIIGAMITHRAGFDPVKGIEVVPLFQSITASKTAFARSSPFDPPGLMPGKP